MTQASLSPGLESDSAIPPAEDPADGRSTLSDEATLWLFGLTSMTLVFASLMLLGLLAQGVIADAAASGFVTALAIFTAVLGSTALVYVLGSARRAGYLSTPAAARADGVAQASPFGAGLIVAPAIPADLGASKRQEQRAQQRARSQRAQAIADANPTPQHPSRPLAAAPRPVHPPTPRPVRPASPRPARPAAPRSNGPAAPGASRVVPGRPVRVMPPNRPPRPAGSPRPAGAAPAFLRLSSGRAGPRVQPVIDQVRMAAPGVDRVQPWSVIETAAGAQVYQPPRRVGAA